MALTRIKDNRSESQTAVISLAGVRLLVQAVITPGAGAGASYTVTSAATRRVILFHDSGVNTDIRVEQNAAAAATDLPVASGMYFVVEAVKDETVQVWNTSAGGIAVNVVEIP